MKINRITKVHASYPLVEFVNYRVPWVDLQGLHAHHSHRLRVRHGLRLDDTLHVRTASRWGVMVFDNTRVKSSKLKQYDLAVHQTK